MAGRISELAQWVAVPPDTGEYELRVAGANHRITPPYMQSGFKFGFRNRLINGSFDIWQRLTSDTPSVSDTYFADRWIAAGKVGTNAYSISRQAFAIGQTDVPGEPQYYARFDVTNNADAASVNFGQKIEDVRSFAGQQAVLSCWAKADQAISGIDVLAFQNFGSGGSATVSSSAADIALTTSWQKFERVFTLASISGKTIGANNALYIQPIRLAAGQTGIIDLARCQIEIGAVATQFEDRPVAVELPLAMRYYQKTFPLDVAPAQNAGETGAYGYRVFNAGANFGGLWVPFNPPMRTSPTAIFYNPGGANALWRNLGLPADSGAAVIQDSSEKGCFIRNAQAAGDLVSQKCVIHATFDAEL